MWGDFLCLANFICKTEEKRVASYPVMVCTSEGLSQVSFSYIAGDAL